jgi:hypothetical protein
MPLTDVIFGVNNNRHPYKFDGAKLKPGSVVHVNLTNRLKWVASQAPPQVVAARSRWTSPRRSLNKALE